MNIFEEKYRNLSEKSDFYKNERLIFMGGPGETPSEPTAIESSTEQSEASVKKDEKPLSNTIFNAHREELSAHIQTLTNEKSNDETEAIMAKFDGELNKIIKAYGKELNALDDNIKVAEQSVATKVENLINKTKSKSEGKLEAKKPTTDETEEVKEKETEQPKKALNEEQVDIALQLLVEKHNVDNEEVKIKIKDILSKIKMTPGQIENMTKEEGATLELDEAQTQQIRAAIAIRILKYTHERGEMIHDQLTNDTVALKAGISDKSADIIDDLFDKDDDPLRQYLVQRYNFTANPNGGLWLIDDSGNKMPIRNVKDLTPYLPESAQNNFEKLLESENPSEEFREVLAKEGENSLKAMKAMQELNEMFRNPNGKAAEALSSMGWGELIATFAQLYQMFKDGDFEGLQDGLADLQNGLKPQEGIKFARQDYEAKVNGTDKEEGIKNTSKLLTLYNDPHGDYANSLFGGKKGDKAHEATRYRMQLKDVIKKRLEGDLKINITKIEKGIGSETIITCAKGRDTYKINLERNGEQTFATMTQDLTDPNDGHAYTETIVNKEEVRDLMNGDKNLASVLGFKETSTTSEVEVNYKELDKKDADTRKAIDDNNDTGEKTRGKVAWAEGRKLFDNSKFDEALPKFQEADNIYPSYLTKFLIAKCMDKTGNGKGAIKFYKRFINAEMTTADKITYKTKIEDTKKRIAVLEATPEKPTTETPTEQTPEQAPAATPST